MINELVKIYLKRRMGRIKSYMREPEKTQEQVLAKLLVQGRNTEFGRRFDFAGIRDGVDFARKVPIHDYDALKGSISRMMHGERDVLWPGQVNWYSKSSGTTNDKSKYIPVPRENLYGSHLTGAWDAMTMLYHNKPDMQVFSGKSLLIPGSHEAFAPYPATRFGDISAVMTQHAPAIARPFYTPDLRTLTSPNFEEKLEKIAQTVAKQPDVVLFSGVPTWVLVLFRRVLEITGKENIWEVWPRLQAFMHGGVGIEPYRAIFRQLIPDDGFVFHETYSASEGYFGAQCDLHQSDVLLLLDNSIYYEFVPMENWGQAHPKTLGIGEVELGKNYAIVISSNNGLWRYQPGDTVCFTRKYPHCVRITGRTRQFINVFGEEVMIGDTDKAVAETCLQTNAVVSEYTAAPVFFGSAQGKGGHEWVIEFESVPSDVERFGQLLDENLQKINSDYEAKRFKGLALERLRLQVVPKGTFVRWMQARGKYGGQNKVPRLANHREYVDAVKRHAHQAPVMAKQIQ
jgi:hypothetical protein